MATDAAALLAQFRRGLARLDRAIRECSSPGPDETVIVSADFCDRANSAWKAADDGRVAVYRALILPHYRQISRNGVECPPTGLPAGVDISDISPTEGGDKFLLLEGPGGTDPRVHDVVKGVRDLFQSMDSQQPFAGHRRFHPLQQESLAFSLDHQRCLQMAIAALDEILEDSDSPELRAYCETAWGAFHGLTHAAGMSAGLERMPPVLPVKEGEPAYMLESPRNRALRDWEPVHMPQLKTARVSLDSVALRCGTHEAVARRADRFEAALAEAYRVMYEAPERDDREADAEVGRLISTAFDHLVDVEGCDDLLVKPVRKDEPTPNLEGLHEQNRKINESIRRGVEETRRHLDEDRRLLQLVSRSRASCRTTRKYGLWFSRGLFVY
jgi:hypothetical protein